MENSIINELRMSQEAEDRRNIFIQYGRWLEREGLEDILENYEAFTDTLPEQYTRDEIIETVDCYFANADTEGDNVVLVNKNDRDEFMVLERDFKYAWEHEICLNIHIVDMENNIIKSIYNITNVVEVDMDTLDLGKWELTIM